MRDSLESRAGTGVFIDFKVTITGLEYYPVLYDFREDGVVGESARINNVTIDERASISRQQ